MTQELTPYDSGEVLEPNVWETHDERERYGRVDFDDDSGDTLLTIKVKQEFSVGGEPTGFYSICLSGDRDNFRTTWEG